MQGEIRPSTWFRNWGPAGVLLSSKVKAASPAWLCVGGQVGITWWTGLEEHARWGKGLPTPLPTTKSWIQPGQDLRLDRRGLEAAGRWGWGRDAQRNGLELHLEGLSLRVRSLGMHVKSLIGWGRGSEGLLWDGPLPLP